MFDLGKSKKVTTVLKLLTRFSPKGLKQMMVLTKSLGHFFLPLLLPLNCGYLTN
jgi:hypothetical protein